MRQRRHRERHPLERRFARQRVGRGSHRLVSSEQAIGVTREYRCDVAVIPNADPHQVEPAGASSGLERLDLE
jgi:hypothetical protein